MTRWSNELMHEGIYLVFDSWCVCVHAQSDTSQPFGLQPARLLCQWDYPGKNTGVGCHFFLQGIFSILRIELASLVASALAFFTTELPGKP